MTFPQLLHIEFCFTAKNNAGRRLTFTVTFCNQDAIGAFEVLLRVGDRVALKGRFFPADPFGPEAPEADAFLQYYLGKLEKEELAPQWSEIEIVRNLPKPKLS